jgi:capsular polysaccharide transport system ATP-binding protein
MIRQMCNMGAVLEGGQLRVFYNLEDAIALHESILRVPPNVAGD